MYIQESNKIWVATGTRAVFLQPSMANRHGLIAGATGTGKTVTLKVIAESFSEMGVPVFVADIKGDLTGMCEPGTENKHVRRSMDNMGLPEMGYHFDSYPVRFFDVYGKQGHPVRTTVTDMGPDLIARLLGLSEAQTGALQIVFKVADDQGLALLDFKDLRSMVQYVGDHASEFRTQYGFLSGASVGAVQRSLLALENEGADQFFGEPALDIEDWMAQAKDGRGVMNILECSELFQHPLLYSSFLLWMLSELYEKLPEVGDVEKPKIAFFFDEAHLLFNDAPKALLAKVEQVVRLIRSKGVSVWFITQNPSDIPESVLGQIGNRVQHALRAYTPNEQKALRYAARSFRSNPAFDTERVLQELATGEALVSMLDAKGTPTMVERANILPPMSSMNIADEAVVRRVMAESPLGEKYDETIDRESAYEILNAKRVEEEEAAAAAAKAEEEEKARKEQEKADEKARKEREKEEARIAKEKAKEEKEKAAQQKKKTKAVEKFISSAANTAGRELGKKFIRGILGNLK